MAFAGVVVAAVSCIVCRSLWVTKRTLTDTKDTHSARPASQPTSQPASPPYVASAVHSVTWFMVVQGCRRDGS